MKNLVARDDLEAASHLAEAGDVDAALAKLREAEQTLRELAVAQALDEPKGLTLTVRPERGPARKLDIDLSTRGYTLVEREWSGCRWRYVGSERLDDVALDVAGVDDV